MLQYLNCKNFMGFWSSCLYICAILSFRDFFLLKRFLRLYKRVKMRNSHYNTSICNQLDLKSIGWTLLCWFEIRKKSWRKVQPWMNHYIINDFVRFSRNKCWNGIFVISIKMRVLCVSRLEKHSLHSPNWFRNTIHTTLREIIFIKL